MATCASCGADVTGKKFCPECGTPVQTANPTQASGQPATLTTCPRCNGEVKAGAAFCMHCGSPLSTQTASAPTAPSQATTQTCPACQAVVPIESAFCTNCGQSMRPQAAAPTPSFCTNCGHQNTPGVRFCASCGTPLTPLTAPPPPAYTQQGPYTQQPQYGQPQYPQYQQQYGYQQDPMLGQQPTVLRCPVCMAMSPVGTSNCPSCRTSLAGVVPTPANIPAQGQQGGFGGFLQGSGGQMAMGALGGAAAVIGGEMLLHGIERSIEGDRGYGGGYRRYDENGNLLGDLGDLANDIGLGL